MTLLLIALLVVVCPRPASAQQRADLIPELSPVRESSAYGLVTGRVLRAGAPVEGAVVFAVR